MASQTKSILLALIFLIGPAYPVQAARVSLPTSDDPETFARQVEQFITRIEEGVGGPDRRAQEESIRNDPRDWETTLARIIGNPAEFGIRTSEIAFEAAKIRRAEARPEIVDALIQLFHAKVDASSKLALKGEDPVVYGRSSLRGLASTILAVKDPQILQTVLEYLNSDLELKLGLLDEWSYRGSATALAGWGRSSNLGEARILLDRVKREGWAEIASDLGRAIKQIERDEIRLTKSRPAAPSPFGVPNKTPAPKADGPAVMHTGWITAAAILFIVITGCGAFIFLRQRG